MTKHLGKLLKTTSVHFSTDCFKDHINTLIDVSDNTSAANKGWSMINYCQSLAFDHSYLSCNHHCDHWNKS